MSVGQATALVQNAARACADATQSACAVLLSHAEPYLASPTGYGLLSNSSFIDRRRGADHACRLV